jgi:hypothetical protein
LRLHKIVREVFSRGGSYEKEPDDHSGMSGALGAGLCNPRRSRLRTLGSSPLGARALGPTWPLDSATVASPAMCGLCSSAASRGPASGSCRCAVLAIMASALLLVTMQPARLAPGGFLLVVPSRNLAGSRPSFDCRRSLDLQGWGSAVLGEKTRRIGALHLYMSRPSRPSRRFL